MNVTKENVPGIDPLMPLSKQQRKEQPSIQPSMPIQPMQTQQPIQPSITIQTPVQPIQFSVPTQPTQTHYQQQPYPQQYQMPSYIPMQYQFGVPDYLGSQQTTQRMITMMQTQINELRSEITTLRMENEQYRTAINYLLHRMQEFDNRIPRPCFQTQPTGVPPEQPTQPIQPDVKRQQTQPIQPMQQTRDVKREEELMRMEEVKRVEELKRMEELKRVAELKKREEEAKRKEELKKQLNDNEKSNNSKREKLSGMMSEKKENKHEDKPEIKALAPEPLKVKTPEVKALTPELPKTKTPEPKDEIVESLICDLEKPVIGKEYPKAIEKEQAIQKLQQEYDELVGELNAEKVEIEKLLKELKD